ncbi:hypothetical protein N5J52_22285, partial [Stenotrophomonas maltophilia]|uniref:hypothetical protein n=1 Tax=Stenotrophomonas maltophilia TaxID=40324 RepID=UPI0024470ED7
MSTKVDTHQQQRQSVEGGVGPVAGDAVNPSMEAWPRHPCRGHPRNRTHPAFDRLPLLLVG